MENQNLGLENVLFEQNFFKLSFKNQNYKKLKEYKIWIKEMNIKFNKSGKEIICDKDNIIIYSIYDDNSKCIYCPICNSSIYSCIYCNNSENSENKKCCIKAYFRYYLKDKIRPLDNNIESNYWAILALFMPLTCSILFVKGFIERLYFDFKKDEYDDYYDDYDYNGIKFNYIESLCSFLDISLYLVIFFFSFIYAIFFFILSLIIVIFSIPFKLYPFFILVKWLAE